MNLPFRTLLKTQEGQHSVLSKCRQAQVDQQPATLVAGVLICNWRGICAGLWRWLEGKSSGSWWTG